MTKIKRIRMKENSFLELKEITGIKRGEVKVMEEVKSLAQDGAKLRKFETIVKDLNEIVYGKALWKKLNKKPKR